MEDVKYALHIMDLEAGGDSLFENGQSYGLFDTFELAESFLELTFTDVDSYIYPVKIVNWD